MIIGIHGKARHGKDTCASYLVSERNFMKYSFADPIKKGASELFGIPLEHFYNSEKTKIDPYWGVSPVTLLISLGTEWAQFDIHEHIKKYGTNEIPTWNRHIWVKRFVKWLQETQYENDQNVVIPDVRFIHEVHALNDLKAKLIKVVRLNDDGSVFAEESNSRTTHSSENDLNHYAYWDKVIEARSTIDLIQQIDNYVNSNA
jgi:hypothetical protein